MWRTFHSVNDDHHDDEYDGYDDYGGDDVGKVMEFYIDGERKNSLFIETTKNLKVKFL